MLVLVEWLVEGLDDEDDDDVFPEFLVGLPPLETAVATWIMWDVEDGEDDEVG